MVLRLTSCIQVEVSYEAARLAKSAILGDSIAAQVQQYRLLPAYLERLKAANPTVFTQLVVNDETSRFLRVFICPQPVSKAFTHLRGLVATDGTHLRGAFVHTLLLAVGIDAENHIVPLAWALVESETESSWRWFLRNLCEAIPEFDQPTTTLISDRDKGLQSADNQLENAQRAYCIQHIAANVQAKYGIEPRRKFIACTYTMTEGAWNTAMDALKDIHRDAYMYVLGIHRHLWAPPFMTAKTWGHPTSNIVESINSLLLEDRKLAIVDLLNALWHKVMDLRFTRLNDATHKIATLRGQLHTEFALERLKDSLKFAQQRRVLCQDRLHGSVVSFSGASYTVDLENASCTCGRFQVNNIPCGHAIALINKLNLQPRDFIPKYFLLTTYKQTYTENLVAVNIANLTPSGDDCYPPHLRKPRGRPKEKRLRKGERCRREIAARAAAAGAIAAVPDNIVQRCSQCRGVGHNRTTCCEVVQFSIGGL
jgi:hypothetical protein